jgi:hypothetical protein
VINVAANAGGLSYSKIDTLLPIVQEVPWMSISIITIPDPTNIKQTPDNM